MGDSNQKKISKTFINNEYKYTGTSEINRKNVR